VQKEKIAAELLRLLHHPEERTAMASVQNPYGDGHSAGCIADILFRIGKSAD
jgi:UDP-N-acetylglucosamine 2-epimerase